MAGMINFRCRHYRAAKPCIFNKQDGSECPTCTHVSMFRERLLFVKLDAIGDVLRSASLIPVLRARHPDAYIAWITKGESVDMVRLIDGVDEVIELNETGMARVRTGGWDRVYSLSNDLSSAAIASDAGGTQSPVGFYLDGGIIRPSNEAAQAWLEMAAFDRLKKANTQSYQRRMCAILDYDGPIQAPALRLPRAVADAAAARVDALLPGPRRRRIAINVGAGFRWPKKMLDGGQIAAVIARLLPSGADILLVGGKAEAEKLAAIEASFPGARVRSAITATSIPEFAAILSQADVLLCGDTLALHVATAIGLKAVALFGPTSAAEIHDFDGAVVKLQSGLDCLVCYGDCDKPVNCMTALDLDAIAARLAP